MKKGSFFVGQRAFSRVLVLALIFSLALPLPMAGHAASRNADDSAIVHARLNSAERQAAIARAAEIDAAAREAFAAQEAGATPGSAAVIPAQAGIQKDGLPRGLAARNDKSLSRPKSITEVMFNAATGMVGLPGLAGNQHDPYDPNADQGLGFHADGTARRADGTTGDNSASAGYNGRRAAAYAGQGLGYSPYGNGLYANEPGYDPVTGQNYRYGDPTNGGRRTNGQSGRSGNFDQFDPQQYFMQRGLNYGMGLANSAAEGLFLGVMDSPYGGARARFNFMIDWDGKVNGEGDLLLPWYDSKYTTVYSQFGARTMNAEDSRDRWIGNFGLGQRWYPYAVNEGAGEDAGNLMLGYNAFFDNDFTRSHQRGGVGIEAQYDWLHLASNYYVPLSSWKGSRDFDSNFVKERAAEGWDIRAKGYLPFYRNVAVTGAYTQWYGDNVGMFGASRLEKDPKVWSYGLEYTPIPLVSGFVNQRQTEQGRSDTEFGLRFTYHFQMPWEEQIKPEKVAQLRTVGGSRHEFVDRENRIILEYKAKNNYHIEFVRRDGDNFIFRVRNGFDKYPTGTMVRVTPSGTQFAEAPVTPKSFFAQAVDVLDGLISTKAAYAADLFRSFPVQSDGTVWVTGLANSALLTGLTVQAGEARRTFTVAELGAGGASSLISIDAFTNGGNFVGTGSSTASVTALVKDASGQPVNGATVTWTVLTAQNSSPAMYSGWGAKKTGLTWGASPTMVKWDDIPELTAVTTSNTDGTGKAIIQLTDIVGERTITIQAKVNISGTDHTVTQAVTYGNGPLSVFKAPDSTNRTWDMAYQLCNSSAYSGDHSAGWSSGAYVGGGKMPTRAEYQAVAPVDTRYSYTNSNAAAQGAAYAAGWPYSLYWTGEALGADYAFGVYLVDGNSFGFVVGYDLRVACRR